VCGYSYWLYTRINLYYFPSSLSHYPVIACSQQRMKATMHTEIDVVGRPHVYEYKRPVKSELDGARTGQGRSLDREPARRVRMSVCHSVMSSR